MGIDNLAYKICEDCFSGELSEMHLPIDIIEMLSKMANFSIYAGGLQARGQSEIYSTKNAAIERGILYLQEHRDIPVMKYIREFRDKYYPFDYWDKYIGGHSI